MRLNKKQTVKFDETDGMTLWNELSCGCGPSGRLTFTKGAAKYLLDAHKKSKPTTDFEMEGYKGFRMQLDDFYAEACEHRRSKRAFKKSYPQIAKLKA